MTFAVRNMCGLQGEPMVAATQGSTQSMSMTLGMPGDLAGAGPAPAGSPDRPGAGRTPGLGDVLTPSATVYRRPFRWGGP